MGLKRRFLIYSGDLLLCLMYSLVLTDLGFIAFIFFLTFCENAALHRPHLSCSKSGLSVKRFIR